MVLQSNLVEMKSGSKTTSKNAGRLFLLDGTSFCYRAYYAIRQLSTSAGEPTNAIYGFVTILHKMLADHKPDSMAICFDRREPTFRHQKFESYKAHRKPMPDDLVCQLEPIKDFCRAMKIEVFEQAGYEADDLLGTLACLGAENGYEVFVVTGDKDMFQLVTDKIKIINPYKEDKVFGIEQVRDRFDGLAPEQVVDVMALMGDSSDNIPGVPGVGEKTALKLIQEFESIENLLKSLDKIKSKSQRALLTDHAESARISKELATIDTKMKITVDWEALKIQEPDEESYISFLKRYEFRNLLKNAMAERTPVKDEDRRYQVVLTEKEFDVFFKNLEKQPVFSFDTETTSSQPVSAHLVGLSFCWNPKEAFYIPVSCPEHEGQGLPLKKVLDCLKSVLENPKQKKYGQNIKYDWMVLHQYGIKIQGIVFDTMIASYLINPLKRNHNLDDITFEHLSIQKIPTESLIGKGKTEITMDKVALTAITDYACEDVDCVFRLEPVLEKKLKEHDLKKPFEEMELPLSEVLAKMELNGVSIDEKFLGELSKETESEMAKLTKKIYEEAGEEFNVDSPKQLSEILFNKLKLPSVKKTKTGFSTDVSVLEKLAAKHELPKMLLEYREKAKLKSTYLDALPEIVNPETGLIHTSYHQTTTVTGRLSSTEPNLQNIPIKTDSGRRVRKAFIPRAEGRKVISADYSQIELRFLAHFCGDENLVKAFKEDRDIHTFTATILNGLEEKEITRQMRNFAKIINFSIIYGKTAYGLSQDMQISVSEADAFIKNYFDRYPKVKGYIESQKEKAREQGYLRTLFGRRCYFPDINSKNVQMRQFAERTAVNAPLQGSAADLIKLAMVRIQDELEKKNLKSLMVMQVHDELVFDVLESELETVKNLVKTGMEEAASLEVPLKVDIFTGDSWFKS